MKPLLSVVIPNYNGSETIGRCLEAVYASDFTGFEVVVVDDCSGDASVEIIRRFPCKLFRLEKHSGAARARNTGAANSGGGILFFTDADCVPKKDTLKIAFETAQEKGPDVVVGGTYTRNPCDDSFFSAFQSVFINHFETKNAGNPDYIATHAMAIHAGTFNESGGFREDFLPIIEDVEFSHRLKRKGLRLVINPGLLVGHVFNYSLTASLRNAYRKAHYWTVYSVKNKDLFADSGTASLELKANTVSYFASIFSVILGLFFKTPAFLYLPLLLFFCNLFVNRKLLLAFLKTGGIFFALSCTAYYTLLYPAAVGAGGMAGFIKALLKKGGV
ncbi:MAG: glycosyltransferase family 2 protein [Nitrospirae bacterium]|nr:MAG: glycosyltransferase family 2 protein [Nitrospirota bacterium]